MNRASTTRCLLLATTFYLAAGTVATTQAQAPGSGGPTPQAPTAVPLDGGASLLLVAGVGLGLRRLRQLRRHR